MPQIDKSISNVKCQNSKLKLKTKIYKKIYDLTFRFDICALSFEIYYFISISKILFLESRKIFFSFSLATRSVASATPAQR